MKTCFVSIVMCLMAVIGLCSCGRGGGGNVPTMAASSGTISNFTVGQSGVNLSPWGDGASSQRPAMAVKFTPTSYPVTITSVTIYAQNNTGSDQLFNLHGYSALSTETEIFSPMLNQIIPGSSTLFSGKTFYIPPTTISGGSFYIAVEWVTKPLTSVSGTNTFFLRTDSHLDYPNSSFIRYTGASWSSLESINPAAGDLGVFVNYGNTVNEKPVVVSTSPSNGTTGVSRNIQEIEIHFNKEMVPSCSVSGDIDWPLSNSTPISWSADHKTCYISRDNASALLPAGTTIHITFNPAGHPQNFMDIFGNTLDSYALTFTTGQ